MESPGLQCTGWRYYRPPPVVLSRIAVARPSHSGLQCTGCLTRIPPSPMQPTLLPSQRAVPLRAWMGTESPGLQRTGRRFCLSPTVVLQFPFDPRCQPIDQRLVVPADLITPLLVVPPMHFGALCGNVMSHVLSPTCDVALLHRPALPLPTPITQDVAFHRLGSWLGRCEGTTSSIAHHS